MRWSAAVRLWAGLVVDEDPFPSLADFAAYIRSVDAILANEATPVFCRRAIARALLDLFDEDSGVGERGVITIGIVAPMADMD